MSEILNFEEVDTSKIQEGQIVKNYRQMCDLLGEERTTGNAKKAQMANWERFFSITKIKGTQKMRIDEIYIEPLERVDGRAKGGRSIYVQSVEVVLLNYLSHQKGYAATFTKNKLYTRLGMTNSRYAIATNKELKDENPTLTDFDINRFKSRASSRLNSILMSALGNLEKRFLIDVVEQVILVDKDGRYSLADELMVRNLTSIKFTVKQEMGFETEQQIYLSGKMKEFYKGVNYYLSKLYGYTRAYTQFKILFNKDNVCQEMPKLAQRVIDRLQEIEEMGDERIRQELISMNNLVVDAFYKSAEKDYSNSVQSGKFQLAYDFVDRQKYLTDALIRRKDNEKVVEYDSSDIEELFTGLMAN